MRNFFSTALKLNDIRKPGVPKVKCVCKDNEHKWVCQEWGGVFCWKGTFKLI